MLVTTIRTQLSVYGYKKHRTKLNVNEALRRYDANTHPRTKNKFFTLDQR